MKRTFISLVGIALLLGNLPAQEKVQEPVPAGQTIRIQGSDTMLQLNLAFMDAYKKKAPGQKISTDGFGSGVGIKQLIEGKVDLAASSRPMKESEIKKLKEKTGKEPQEILVAIDAIGVYAHPSNPIDSITVNELKAIFIDAGEIATWEAVNKDLAKEKAGSIKLYGRSNSSGTYAAFRDLIAGKGAEFKKGIAKVNGSVALVEAISQDPNGLGYSGAAYKNDKVKFLQVHTGKPGSKPALPDSVGVSAGGYPLVKKLLFYSAGEPQGLVKEFVEWLKSNEARKIIEDQGFIAP